MSTKIVTRMLRQPCSDVATRDCWNPQKNQKRNKTLTMSNLNPNIIKLEYAVRGPLVARAAAIEQELKKGSSKPFKSVIRANLGDAHAMGQAPITFMRQVCACIIDPTLINSSSYPADVKSRAKSILAVSGGQSVGAYTASYGIDAYRQQIADFIKKRDGHSADPANICLVAGASAGIKHILELLVNTVDGKPSGVMVPIPQYPFYSATIAEFGMTKVDYFLDEDKGWGLDINEIDRAFKAGSAKCKVRAIVIINPGNPTGQVLSRKNIEDVIDFSKKNNILIFADEVYQSNVYAKGSEFHSFKKVLMDGSHSNSVEVVSFMSASKGYQGECGLRGGWMECTNLDPDVQANLYKAMSAMLCPSSIGQAIISCVAQPPNQNDPSYELFIKEKNGILQVLGERALMVQETFNKMPGFKCNAVQGAMYAFPSFDLPKKAIAAAEKENKKPDVFYAFRLLEETGICVVAGSGFGQRPGTYHFRTTILPQTPLLKHMLQIFDKFHAKFTKDFS